MARKGKPERFLSKGQLASLFGSSGVSDFVNRGLSAQAAVDKLVADATAAEHAGEPNAAPLKPTHYAMHDGRKVWNAEWIERVCARARERGCLVTPRAVVVLLETLEEIEP